MVCPQDVCELLSEIVSSGVEKALGPLDMRRSSKDFALILSHKVQNAKWGEVAPSLSEIDFAYYFRRMHSI